MDHNRLEIATRIAAALHSNPACDSTPMEEITKVSFAQADSLLKYAAQSEPVDEKRLQDWIQHQKFQGTPNEFAKVVYGVAEKARKTAGELAKEATEDFDIQEWATFHGIHGDPAKLRNAFFDARNR